MITFSESEKKFLNSLEEARIATSHNDIPHVKPVSFLTYNNSIIVATDYETRTYKNLKNNPKAAIAIDTYKSGAHKAVCIQGNVKIVETGKEFLKFYEMFDKKFEWVRNDPWKENEAPFLKVIPFNKTSWGLSQ